MSLPTSLWGMSFWKTLHFSTLSYNNYPSEEEKTAMKNFIEALPYLLPCPECRAHLRTNLREMPLTEDILSVKLRLIIWVHELHNRVNLISKKSILSFEDAMISLFIDNIEHNYDEPSNYIHNETVESQLEEWKKKRKLNATENIINVNDVYELYDKEINEMKELNRKSEEGRIKSKKFFTEEQWEDMEKRRLFLLEETKKKKYPESEVNIKYEPQIQINVELLIQKFVNAIHEQKEEYKKHEIAKGLLAILNSF